MPKLRNDDARSRSVQKLRVLQRERICQKIETREKSRSKSIMKTALDPRHKKRQKIVEDLFKVDFHKQPISESSTEIMTHIKSLDEDIAYAAPEFPIDKINKVDLAILRLAVYELTVAKKEPPKVIVDEAIELAKEYGGDSSPAFVNGALGKVVNHDKSSKN